MSEQYLNYIILLEKTLASFYQQYSKRTDYLSIKSVLEFMEIHSESHAVKIEESKSAFTKPVLDEKLIMDAHNRITVEVRDEISAENDLKIILQILADSEESIGKLYEKIADYLKETADYYTSISEEIRQIAKEEYDHRDILLADKKRLED